MSKITRAAEEMEILHHFRQLSPEKQRAFLQVVRLVTLKGQGGCVRAGRISLPTLLRRYDLAARAGYTMAPREDVIAICEAAHGD
ncbi:MAG: hypothetical protein E5V89_09775 [Mesorhizobium sp.]|nr:MAG: hypothetical protein E5V89_09775 [Mesorhizobium sp.]